MKKGFTLAELLISLALVAVVVAVTIPVITKSITSSDLRVGATLYKSAFKTAESIVSDLSSDLNLYPIGNFYNATTSGYFCNNFAAKVNIIGSSSANCTAGSGVIPTLPNFTTTNGMRWYGLYNNFSTNNATIYVDIDGAGKGVNSITPGLGSQLQDILQINISNSGRMTTPSSGIESAYLSQ